MPESKVPFPLTSLKSATVAPATPTPPSLAKPSPLTSLSTEPLIVAVLVGVRRMVIAAGLHVPLPLPEHVDEPLFGVNPVAEAVAVAVTGPLLPY